LSRRCGQKGSITERNGQWRVRFWQDVPGQEQRVRKSLVVGPSTGPHKLTESQARRKGAELIHNLGIDTEEYFHRVTSPVQTFRQKAEWIQENDPAFIEGRPGYIHGVQSHLRVHILPSFGDLPLAEVTEERVQEFIGYLKRTTFERRRKDGSLIKRYKLSYSTVRNIVKTIKKVVSKKVWISWDLKLGRAPEVKQRYFTEEEMLRIIDAAQGTWKVFFSVLAATGMRIGELCGLEVGEVDLIENVIYVNRSFSEVSNSIPTKTKKGTRAIDIDANLAGLIGTYLEEQKRNKGPLFPSRRGTPLRPGIVCKRVLRPLLDRIGIPSQGRINHAFRHGRGHLVAQARGSRETGAIVDRPHQDGDD
jgi:integrase